MSFVSTSVDRPVLTTMVVGSLIVFGLFSFTQFAQDLVPKVEFPFVVVTTIYPGAGPKEIESQVTEKLEDEIGSVAGLKRMESQSLESLSLILLEFELDIDADLAAIEVKDKVDLAMINLPDDVEPPIVQQYSFDSFPVLNVAVYSDRPLPEITQLADTRLKDAVSRVDGVSKVDLIGGLQREIHVACRADRLRAYGLSIMEVVGLIQAENFNFPTGRIIGSMSEYSLRMVGEMNDLERLRAMRIPVADGASIRLRDVADVIDAYEEPRAEARFQGKPAVSLQVMKKSDANTVDISAGVHEAMAKLAPWVAQENLTVEIINDRAKYIEDSVSDVTGNIWVGVILTSILLYLFLHDYRQTFIVATVMPGSVVATFALMNFAGFTLNIISLMALGISVGTIVTNSIVVLENITTKLNKGLDSRDAAIEGTSEVAVAVAASTLTNIVVFTPIAFMKGIIGQFFYQFGLTVVFATLVSLLISFTLVPMLARLVLARPKGHLTHHDDRHPTILERFAKAWDRFYDELAADYGAVLRASLRKRWLVLVITILSFAGGCGLLTQVGAEFFPEGDEGIFRIIAKLPPGTSLAQTDRTLRAIESRMTGVVEIKSVLSEVGGAGKGVEDGQVTVQLVDHEMRTRTVAQVMDEIRPRLVDVPAAEIQLVVGDGGGGPGQGVQVEVTGPELVEVNRIAGEVLAHARTVPGIIDLRSTYEAGKPELSFTPDRQQLASYGLTTQQVAFALRTAFEGQEVTYFREHGEDYDIRVLLDKTERADVSAFGDVLIRAGDHQVPLSQLGQIRYTQAETKIERKDKQRIVKVLGNVSGITTGQAVDALQPILDEKVRVPEGYDIHFGGEAESMAEEFGYIFQALILAIILTYMLLAAILEDFVHPFTIMLTLPLGMIGVAMALFIGGVSINMMSLMGIVMLVGIVVNNAILILDYVRVLREQGKPIGEALIESSASRLRPIIMMNLAIALSVLPQTLSGAGAEFRRALAVVTMGGVLVSAIFTLFLIPAIYTAFDRFAVKPKVKAGA